MEDIPTEAPAEAPTEATESPPTLPRAEEETIETLREKNRQLQSTLNQLGIKAKQKISQLNLEVTQLKSVSVAAASSLVPSTSASTATPAQTTTADDLNFTLQEQVRDLKIQLSAKQADFLKLSESHTALKQQHTDALQLHDQKFKKIKQLFQVANTQLSQQKDEISKKDLELADFSRRYQDVSMDLDSVKGEKLSLMQEISTLNSELASLNDANLSKSLHFENTIARLEQELAAKTVEFQMYKDKAYSVLSQQATSTNSSDSKVLDLELAINRLQSENQLLSRDNDSLLARIQELHSLNKSQQEHSQVLHGQIATFKAMQGENLALKQEVSDLYQRLESTRDSYEEIIKSKDQQLRLVQDQVRAEMANESSAVQLRLAERDSQLKSLNCITENLSLELKQARDQIDVLTSQLEAATLELQQVRKATSDLPKVKSLSDSSPAIAATSIHGLFGDSLGSPSVASGGAQPSHKERELEAKITDLMHLLAESELTVSRLTEQDRILKEEIRKSDRMDKRQQVNMEYLKNIVLKFMEAPTEPLLPVIHQLLCLDKDEYERMKDVLRRKSSQQQSALFSNFW